MTMLDFWVGVLEQGLIFGVMVLGVYITYKILDFPDLSVDGSFPLGAAVAAALLTKGVNPLLATAFSLGAGALAGGMTALLHTKLKITNLMAGILIMIGLYSINLRIMGKANVPLFNEFTLFSYGIAPLLMIAIFALFMKLILDLFLRTKLGFLLKATGDNPQLVTSLGRNIGTMKLVGLMLSNGLVALSGALMARYQGFADVGMGSGMIVVGLASIIIGEAVFKNLSVVLLTTTALGGAIFYKASTAFAIHLGFPPTDLKLITAIIVIIALGVQQKKLNVHFKWKGKAFRSLRSDVHVANRKSV